MQFQAGLLASRSAPTDSTEEAFFRAPDRSQVQQWRCPRFDPRGLPDRAYRSPARRNAHPGIQFSIAGTENSPRVPILSRIGTCPRPSAPSTPSSAGSCLRSRHAERTESTVRQIPLASAVIVIGRPSQLPVRWPSICRAVIGVGPRSAWGDISRAQVAGADLHGAVKDPLGVRG